MTQCRTEGMSVNHSGCLRVGRERMGQSPGHPAGAPGGRRARRKLAGGDTETSSLQLTQALSPQLPFLLFCPWRAELKDIQVHIKVILLSKQGY